MAGREDREEQTRWRPLVDDTQAARWSSRGVGRDILRQCTLSRTHTTLLVILQRCTPPLQYTAPPVPLYPCEMYVPSA